VTPDGYIYSKEAILENLLQQKKAIKRKLAAYEAQQAEEQQKVPGQQQLQHTSLIRANHQ
jgi:nitric oxide synthase-interacting protein